MAASAPDPAIPLGFKNVVNRMAGQTILVWNRPFCQMPTGLVTGNGNRARIAEVMEFTKTIEFRDHHLARDLQI